MLTGTFFVPLDPKRVLVAKDSKENRQKYERLLVESVYVPGVTTTEMTEITNVAKNVFDAPVAVGAADERNPDSARAGEPDEGAECDARRAARRQSAGDGGGAAVRHQ